MRYQKGFTLIELVVVIMILGVLAAVAAPRFMGTSATASENGLRQSLSVIRSAIELYAAENIGEYPGAAGTEASFKEDLEPYLRGPAFPTCPVGNRNNKVAISREVELEADGGDASWVYNPDTGEFICNSSAKTTSDPELRYDQL